MADPKEPSDKHLDTLAQRIPRPANLDQNALREALQAGQQINHTASGLENASPSEARAPTPTPAVAQEKVDTTPARGRSLHPSKGTSHQDSPSRANSEHGLRMALNDRYRQNREFDGVKDVFDRDVQAKARQTIQQHFDTSQTQTKEDKTRSQEKNREKDKDHER